MYNKKKNVRKAQRIEVNKQDDKNQGNIFPKPEKNSKNEVNGNMKLIERRKNRRVDKVQLLDMANLCDISLQSNHYLKNFSSLLPFFLSQFFFLSLCLALSISFMY